MWIPILLKTPLVADIITISTGFVLRKALKNEQNAMEDSKGGFGFGRLYWPFITPSGFF